MISNLIGDAETAYYTVAHTVSGIIMIVWNAINASLVPFTYEKCKNRDYKAISNATLPILSLFAVMCLAVIMFAPEIVMIMATKDYMEAIYVIPPLIGGVFLQVHYFIYGNILYYYKKPVYLMLSSVPATILNVILNYIFISKCGYIAAGYTTILCYLVQAIANYIGMRKVVKEEVYNMKFIGLLTLSVVVISVLSNLLYDYFVIRYLILALIAVMCIIFRKKIIGIVVAIRKKNN
jgi:O-antigen/teichoic acid export membrane protein